MTRGDNLLPGVLARRLTRAPRLADPDTAHARVDAWLATPAGAAVAPLLGEIPLARALVDGIADGSSFLWDLIERPDNPLAALLKADPDAHLRGLLDATMRAMATAGDDDAAMRLLRRMKSDAALLIALADIGGVWDVMRVVRALTDVADTAIGAAVDYLLRGAARAGKLALADAARPGVGSGYIVLAMGKIGRAHV